MSKKLDPNDPKRAYIGVYVTRETIDRLEGLEKKLPSGVNINRSSLIRRGIELAIQEIEASLK